MIVITAPTGQIGQIGQQVLDRLVDTGRPVRVIARDPSRLSARVRGSVEVVRGSHQDRDVVTRACEGAESLLWLVPPDPGAHDIDDHYMSFTRSACEANETRGVRRVVGVTSLGRAYGKHAGLLSPAFAMDALIESTGVNYRALAMPYFMENLLHQVGAIRTQGMLFTPNSASRPLATVATRDIAAAAAELLLDDSWRGQDTVPVIGPDELSPDAMAAVVSDVLGRPVRCQETSPEAYRATMTRYGTAGAWAQGLADMAAAQNDGIYDAEQRALTSPAPTSFREWCQDVLKPAVLA
ncbi:NAD(P)H-binding protein [Streptomyces sp. G-G2]|uniref:NAD(P)H-binding protein n=1 Tax=Streptomyces sp. G-G2 TaxID=3046201 RepID=UPI0024BB6670|nr:NAD(P)H-binding protein [Streptomyces sp. G-G2]MDJ0382000.1 NAD(P)H-binding protein [Streptomyces sp. G-G2]